MAKLAIRGDLDRGNEVIEILRMLGGWNKYMFNGHSSIYYYLLNASRNSTTIDIIQIGKEFDEFSKKEHIITFTIGEFLKKYPYKVGDELSYRGYFGKITDMVWENDGVVYTIETEQDTLNINADFLKQYNENSINMPPKLTTDIIGDAVESFDITSKIESRISNLKSKCLDIYI